MTIDLGPELEAALKDAAERRGTDPQTLILETLRRDFAKPKMPDIPFDEWLERLRSHQVKDGAYVEDKYLSREEMYDL